MLELVIEDTDLWDPKNERFYSVKRQTLVLEHSLVSLSKWESKWHKPFLSSELTNDEVLDYIRCMTVNRNVDPLVYNCLNSDHFKMIEDYIADPHTATWFSNSSHKNGQSAVITAERIYHLMFAYGIDKECEKWHLNQLLTQIRVEYEESKPQKKHSKREIADRHRALNAARRKATTKKH